MAKLSAPTVSTPRPTTMVAHVPAGTTDTIRLSWDNLEGRHIITIYGRPGVGKTTCAATASSLWPKGGLPTERWVKKTPRVVLEDMLWISADVGALVGFRERGIAVPEFDVFRWIAERPGRSIISALDALALAAAGQCAKGAKWIVIDTITAWDSAFEQYARDHMAVSRGGKDLTQKMWGDVYHSNLTLHQRVIQLGINVIYLAHEKAMNDMSDMNQQQVAQILANQSAGDATRVPAVTGKGQRQYKGDSAHIFALVSTTSPKGEITRKLLSSPAQGYEAKNRTMLSIPPSMPADLQAVLAALRGE